MDKTLKMPEATTKKLPQLPETLLKKRKLNAQRRARLAKSALEAKRKNTLKRRDIFKRAEKYLKEYMKSERNEIRLRRQAKQHGNFYVPPEPKLVAGLMRFVSVDLLLLL